MSEQTQALILTNQFMPAMAIADAVARHNAIVTFVKTVMVEGTDFGTIPGTDKPTLLKAGAEKLNTLFGLSSHFTVAEKEVDWTGAAHNGEPFFYFVYRCQLYRNDLLIAEADGSCNSMEKKYRYRWLPSFEALRLGINLDAVPTMGGRTSEFEFAVEKAETTGKYGKPASYWQQFRDAIQNNTAKRIKKKIKDGSERDAWEIDSTLYRVPNPDMADIVNTVQKMAQKRALVAATLLAVNASEFFTQDVEDMDIIEGSFSVKAEQNPTTQAAQRSPATNGKAAAQSEKANPLDALITQSQGLLDKPPAEMTGKQFDIIKANWTKLYELARTEGCTLIAAVPADGKPSDYLKGIVTQGAKLKEFRAAVAAAEQLAQAQPAQPATGELDISDWIGGAK